MNDSIPQPIIGYANLIPLNNAFCEVLQETDEYAIVRLVSTYWRHGEVYNEDMFQRNENAFHQALRDKGIEILSTEPGLRTVETRASIYSLKVQLSMLAKSETFPRYLSSDESEAAE